MSFDRKAYMKQYNKKYHAANTKKNNMSSKAYRDANPEKVREGKKAYYAKVKANPVRYAKLRKQVEDARIQRKYGITADDIIQMSEEQNGCCGLCGKRGKLVVDHNHVAGQVRGLLCRACNGFLGMLGDDEKAVIRLKTYLHMG